MNTYTIMPTDIIEAQKHTALMNSCGSYPFMTKSYVENKIKQLKKEYPNVKLGLYKGDTWGTLQLIKEY